MPTWRASPSSSQHLRCFVFPNAVICVASEHKADSPEVQPCFLGWRRRWWGLGKLGSAEQRKCAGNRGDASVRGPCSRSSSVVGVVGPDTARPHAQLSSLEGPCVLITLLHIPAAAHLPLIHGAEWRPLRGSELSWQVSCLPGLPSSLFFPFLLIF